MQLSAEQLVDFTTALRAPDRKLPHDDRRRTPRLDVRSRVVISLITGGERQQAQSIRLRDLSPRGVSMLHTEDFVRGQQFLLTLPRDNSDPVTILCTTVYSKPVAGRLRLIGAEFVCAANEEQPAKSKQDEAAELLRIRNSMLD